MSEQNKYLRFALGQRIEHILLILSFTTLVVTGIPQKYVGSGWAESMIALMGGIELVRIIHRIAATLFVLETVYHVILLGYKIFVLRAGWSMIPSVKDLRDGVQAFLYNLGFAKRRPRMGRYTFDEKMEYWALIWGLIVMVVTGFMMWNPIATTSVLPGQIIPAAKVAHGGEALLAALAIIIWHTYHVHLRKFNKSMWSGTLTEEEMQEDHPLELEEIKVSQAKGPELPDATLDQRRNIYYPVASLIGALLVVGVYWFVSFENTSITTIPPEESAVVFSPQTPTPFPTAAPSPTSAPVPTGAALTWDGSIGAVFQQKCGTCHGGAGGLSLKTYADALKGGSNGPVIVAGDAAGSPLVTLQAGGNHPGLFSADELAQVKEWIDAGAPEK
ncbi:MAG: cytochrome b/b6 domain-containing protein [Chloroflexi bacterium]|nr:cytochrome b/b6 domain-containing protein [Chloroflexota bacterium]